MAIKYRLQLKDHLRSIEFMYPEALGSRLERNIVRVNLIFALDREYLFSKMMDLRDLFANDLEEGNLEGE